MKNDLTVFPAIVSFDGNNYHVNFIDLHGCSVIGEDMEKTCYLAQKAMVNFLIKQSTIPPPTLDFSDVSLKEGEHIVLISAYLPLYMDISYVKKTLTLPSWLNEMALKNNINFSQLLQKALKKELGIE